MLAYTFGLRHALDADHIAAIDNVNLNVECTNGKVCRKLVAMGQTPGTIGTFFRLGTLYHSPTEDSLGHSTVVIIMTIIVAATSAALADKFDTFETIGGIIGVSVSCSSTS